MAKEDVIKTSGEIIDSLPNTVFKIALWDDDDVPTGIVILGHLAGKMRRNQIRVAVGDTVLLELSPYDLTKGRIVRRL